jgi:[ribosomal protein S5]-alanine N-acetyltransferase
MPEALRAMLRYGFDRMALHRVEANVDPENLASRRVLEKLGFVQEALVRENWYHERRYIDTAFYGLLQRDFDRVSSRL